jgi:hypothetical protein
MARGRMFDRGFFQSHEWDGFGPWLPILIGSMILHADDNGCHPVVEVSWLRRRYLGSNAWGRGVRRCEIQRSIDRLLQQKV